MFITSTDGTAQPGAKKRMLQSVFDYVVKRCPNVKFTLSDKDVDEIDSMRAKITRAKHQLCCWHAIRYITQRLAENKPPAHYDPRQAYSVFDFIDPTWAPGVMEGWIEDGVCEDVIVGPKPAAKPAAQVKATSTAKPKGKAKPKKQAGASQRNNGPDKENTVSNI